jgi:hypothetical protein
MDSGKGCPGMGGELPRFPGLRDHILCLIEIKRFMTKANIHHQTGPERLPMILDQNLHLDSGFKVDWIHKAGCSSRAGSTS